MKSTRKLLLGAALVPALLLPTGCDEAKDAASKAADSVQAAGSAIAEKAGDLTEGLQDLGKEQIIDRLKSAQPMIEDAIASLKDNAGNLTEGMKDKLSKLTEFKDDIPGLISKLKDGTGDALTGALAKAKEMLMAIPELLSGLKGE